MRVSEVYDYLVRAHRRLWATLEDAPDEVLCRPPTLSDDDLKQPVRVEDWPDKRFSVDGLLWHVMIHEMRHTAQSAVLLRTQGFRRPLSTCCSICDPRNHACGSLKTKSSYGKSALTIGGCGGD